MSAADKIRVGLLFGGRSGEHEVSVISAQSVLEAIDRNQYEVIPIRISRRGQWTVLPSLSRLESLGDLGSLPGGSGTLSPCSEGGSLMVHLEQKQPSRTPLDVVFPLLHGVFGEDGTMQGLLSLADVAFVGAEVLASAVGMDKIVMKQVFQQAGLRVVPYVPISRHHWRRHPKQVVEEIEARLGYPCFIKPANTGSSVGVYKVHQRDELEPALHEAAKMDLKLIAEAGMDARELECGVLGNDEPEASVVGEVVPCHEFYDYEAKYISEGSRVIIPAELEPDLVCRIQQWSLDAYRAIDCCGMARVDFFLEKNSRQLYVNEINTIPGFTPRSMFPRLWEASGVSYAALIDRLIQLALQRYQERQGTQGREQ